MPVLLSEIMCAIPECDEQICRSEICPSILAISTSVLFVLLMCKLFNQFSSASSFGGTQYKI